MHSDQASHAAERGPAVIFWLWLTATFGGLALMLVIVVVSL